MHLLDHLENKLVFLLVWPDVTIYIFGCLLHQQTIQCEELISS